MVTTRCMAILVSALYFFGGNHLSFWKSKPVVLHCTKKEPNQLLPLLFKVAVSSCNPSGDCRQRHWPGDRNPAAGRDRPCTAIPTDPTTPARHRACSRIRSSIRIRISISIRISIRIRLQPRDFPWKPSAVRTQHRTLSFQSLWCSFPCNPAADNLINIFM